MKKIFNFLKKLFNKAKFYIQQFVTPAVATVENLKKIIDSPAVDIVTAIIPGNVDNVIVAKIRLYLPKVLVVLRISDECLKLTNPDEIILCAVKKLKDYTPDEKAVAFHSMAALLSHYMSDGKLSWSEAVHLAEMVYQDNFKK